MYENNMISIKCQNGKAVIEQSSNVNGKTTTKKTVYDLNDPNSIRKLLLSKLSESEDDVKAKRKAIADADDCLFFDDEEDNDWFEGYDEEELREEEYKYYKDSLKEAISLVSTIEPECYNDVRVLKEVRALKKACAMSLYKFDTACSEDGLIIY